MCDSAEEPRAAEFDRVRRRIAAEAARGVTGGGDCKRAVFRAARRVVGEWVPTDRLPDAGEVRRDVHHRLDATGSLAHLAGDRFDSIASVVAVLATVRQNPERHPEGDALEHSLQVFDLVHRERPFDEELLTAALLHDAGLAIDRRDPVAAAIEAVGDLVTPRTCWLIASLPAATAYAGGRLGHRARKRLETHPDFLDVMLLADADRGGRQKGYPAPSLAEAIEVLRALEAESDGAESDGAESDGAESDGAESGGSDAVVNPDEGCAP